MFSTGVKDAGATATQATVTNGANDSIFSSADYYAENAQRSQELLNQ
jgi:hypothetical protein